jgi:hypothetical protein
MSLKRLSRSDVAWYCCVYLTSYWWNKRRWRYLDKCEWRCDRCADWATAVRHLSYRDLYKEPDEDLQALCNRCHAAAHGVDFDLLAANDNNPSPANDNSPRQPSFKLADEG